RAVDDVIGGVAAVVEEGPQADGEERRAEERDRDVVPDGAQAPEGGAAVGAEAGLPGGAGGRFGGVARRLGGRDARAGRGDVHRFELSCWSGARRRSPPPSSTGATRKATHARASFFRRGDGRDGAAR